MPSEAKKMALSVLGLGAGGGGTGFAAEAAGHDRREQGDDADERREAGTGTTHRKLLQGDGHDRDGAAVRARAPASSRRRTAKAWPSTITPHDRPVNAKTAPSPHLNGAPVHR